MVVNSTVEKFCSAVSSGQGNDKRLSQHRLLRLEPALVSSMNLCNKKQLFYQEFANSSEVWLSKSQLVLQKSVSLTKLFKNLLFNFFLKFACIGQREAAQAYTRGLLDWVLGEKSLHQKGCQTLEQAIQGRGGVIIPGDKVPHLHIPKRCVNVAL